MSEFGMSGLPAEKAPVELWEQSCTGLCDGSYTLMEEQYFSGAENAECSPTRDCCFICESVEKQITTKLSCWEKWGINDVGNKLFEDSNKHLNKNSL